MDAFDWTCPFCNRAQAVTENQFHIKQVLLPHYQSVYGPRIVEVVSVRCANADCMKMQLNINLYKALKGYGQAQKDEFISSWPLLPESSAKPQPDYIPKQIVEDYTEACNIRDLSPKASATLARRCIQGIIRNFCNIQGNSLYSEIEELKNRVENGDAPENVLQDTVNALHHVRSIGNIGAHMEKDVNLIIDIEPDELEKLIWLIELLFDEWHIHRHDRAQNFRNSKR